MKRYDAVMAGKEPVSGEDLADSLRIPKTASAVQQCARWAKVARDLCEQWCRIYIAKRTVTLYMDNFRTERRDDAWWDGVRDGAIGDVFPSLASRDIELPCPPLISVTSLSTFDEASVETVMAPELYYVDVSDPKQPGRIVLKRGAVWPVAMREANAIKIVYEAGWTDNNVPESIREAILLVGGKLYSDRGDCQGDCVGKCGASTLLATFKVLNPP